MPQLTLDAVASVTVDSDDYFNECRTLQMLSRGLGGIAENLKRRETAWEQRTAGKVKFHVYGLDIDGTKGDLDLIACFFHWFGVSVCNYARLVGFLRGLSTSQFTRADLADPARFRTVSSVVDGYVNSISELSAVLVWRHKVGAHFAITAPRKDDNISTLDMSVMFPVSFTDGRYRVGELTLTRTTAAGTYMSEIPHWVLTEVFESLMPRYWPHITVAAQQASRPAQEAAQTRPDEPPEPASAASGTGG
jgi:hypothetical protein